MRIGVLTTSYPRDDEDPAGAFVAGFSRWLAARADVEVLCASDEWKLFYRGGAPLALRRRWPEAIAFSTRLLAEAAVRARRWDAVVSHWLVPCGAIGAILRRPHLAVAHGSDVRLAPRALVRQIAAGADLVYVSDELRVAGAPGRVVPMGVDTSAWRGGDRARMRAALGLERFTALYLGRLIQQKGVDRAVDQLPDGIDLLIAGDGPERPRARERVRFVGEVRGRDKRDLLAAADVLVVPSRVDGAPTVILEALAAGRPIVGTPVGGIPALIGDAGIVTSQLGQALTRLRDDGALYEELAARARERATSFDWAAIGPRLALNFVSGQTGGGRVHVTRV